jgi:hypothetical protein
MTTLIHVIGPSGVGTSSLAPNGRESMRVISYVELDEIMKMRDPSLFQHAGDRCHSSGTSRRKVTSRFWWSQWKTPRTTNVIERLREEFRRRVKTQGSLPTEDVALVLLLGLVVSGRSGCAGSTGGGRSRRCSANDRERRHEASRIGARISADQGTL